VFGLWVAFDVDLLIDFGCGWFGGCGFGVF